MTRNVERCMVTKAETKAARQLFLYGNGDGKRVLNVKALVAATGVHVGTIWKHMPAWQKEAEDLVANATENGLALSLSSATLKTHETDMLHLRNLVEANKFEQDKIDDVTAKLESWMEKFAGNPEDQDKALRILELWVRTCGQKSTIISQFLALQKQWTALSGIIDLKDIQTTREKTIAVGRAKLKLRGEEAEAGKMTPAVNRSGIFDRPAIEEAEDPES